MVLPVLVLAEGTAVAGHVAPGACLTGFATAVPAALQEREGDYVEVCLESGCGSVVVLGVGYTYVE